MLLRTFWDARLAHYAYLIACQETREAVIVDPSRLITPYIDAAREEGLTIVGAIETHIHADFVSGSRELHALGATLYLSAEGDLQPTYESVPADHVRWMHEGDIITLGNVRLQALHTPGHTPEHLCYLVTDTATSDQPLALLSGDCLFVGDVGRPDLLDKVAGTNNSQSAAHQQFANIQRLKTLAAYVQVLPGHGAGSACGKALGSVPASTIGYENLVNSAFQWQDADAFASWLLAGQPEMPAYFRQMKHINRQGAALLADIPTRPVADLTHSESALWIDTRRLQDYAAAHRADTISIPVHLRSFTTYAGWYVRYSEPTCLLAYAEDMPAAIEALRTIGVDDLYTEVITPDDSSLTQTLPLISPQTAFAEGRLIVDVRNADELAGGRVPESLAIHMGDIEKHLSDLPHDQSIAVLCGSGVRSAIVASLLQRHGFSSVASVRGGISDWKKNGLPLIQG